ncbi:MAG: UDP-glucose 4-epimerase GalE [bacterium]|nr:UDP-glucose 4-epimerase GalE [bacterium]
MKVLVIGGAGYIGSHTVKALQNAGHSVIVFDNLSAGHHEGSEHRHEAHIVKGDIRNRKDLDEIFSGKNFDAVMHFAAKIEVKESMIDPGLFYENNVLGSINILEAMRKHEVKIIIFSSTAAVYGLPEEVPITEETKLSPINTYGDSKLMVEKIIRDYHRSYGLNGVILRYFNAAGASTDGSIGERHDPESHLIPILIKKLLKNESATINGNDYSTPDGTAIRDYVHVQDIAQAHVLALEYADFEKAFNIFNIGTGTGYSIKQVVEALEKVTGKELKVEYGPRREGDPAQLVASSDKIQKTLGWEPQYSGLETIIQTAYQWHKKHQ